MRPLAPGATIGILGGGQLGRLLALEAARLGFDAHVYDDEPDGPAARAAARATCAGWEDEAALRRFADAVDLVTYEWENVPVAAVEALAAHGAVIRPGVASLRAAQDRATEKALFASLGIPTVAWREVDSRAQLDEAVAALGPGLLKRRRLGYDGKGQARVDGPAAAESAWARLAGAPLIYEALARFEREISVLLARGVDGTCAAWDPPENLHRDGILVESLAPARVSAETAAAAVEMSRRVADRLDHVGVIAVEWFVLPGGALLANELAPRVHNSGHWTPEACRTGQFEQHVRAVAGWPLGDPTRHAPARLENLLGADVERWRALAAAGARVTVYGKDEARPGRKMGHAVWVG